MAKCTSCGREAVKSGNYWLVCKDNFNVRTLLGAAKVGLCSDCLLKYTKPTLRKPTLRAILWSAAIVAIAVFFFVGGYLNSGNTKAYLLFAAMLAIAVFMDVRVITSLVEFRQKLKKPVFVDIMDEEDFEYAAAKFLTTNKKVDKGVIFNCDKLSDRALKIVNNGALGEKNREYVTRPINFPKFKDFGIIKFHKDYVNIPTVQKPDLSKEENLKKAIKICCAEHYEKEIKI